jgi:4-hydroxy-tetrahydrodipicolinate synthase
MSDVLTGLSAFPLTPMDADGVVDTDHLQRLVGRLTGADSIGVLGSTGSYMYLSAAQRARALQAAVEAAGDTPVLAGIGDLRQDNVIAHARAAEQAGAAALLLAPVSYLPLSDDDFAGLVAAVCAATDLPVCLYNNPGTTHFTMSPALVVQLSAIPGVQAVKNPAAGADVAALRAGLPAGFVMGFSGDAAITQVLAEADAWYSVAAGTLPHLALAMWRARGDAAALQAINARAQPLWDLFNAHGGIRVVPAVGNLLALGPLRLPLPLQPLPGPAMAKLEQALDALTLEDKGLK